MKKKERRCRKRADQRSELLASSILAATFIIIEPIDDERRHKGLLSIGDACSYPLGS